MIRFIIKRTAMCADGSVTGGDYITVDADVPELEKALKSAHTYEERQLSGAEVRTDNSDGAGNG